MNLLDLPAQGELQLTPEELERLTGAVPAALQLDWLRSNGWAFSVTRAGKPVVGRQSGELRR